MEHTQREQVHPHKDPHPSGPPPQDTPAPEPSVAPGREYPKNSKGDPEFASVVLTLDHLLFADAHDVVQKFVYSTKDAEGTLLALIDYYKESQIKLLPSTLDLLVQGRMNPEGSIYLYSVPLTNLPATPGRIPSGQPNTGGVIVQVVMSTPAFYDLINHPDVGRGSALLAVNWLVETVTGFLEGLKKAKGAYPPLSLFQLEHGIRPPEQAN